MTQFRAHISLALHCRHCCKADFFCPFCTAGMEFHADKNLGRGLEMPNTLLHTCRGCGAMLAVTTQGFVYNRPDEPRVLDTESAASIKPLETALAQPAVEHPKRRRWPFFRRSWREG